METRPPIATQKIRFGYLRQGELFRWPETSANYRQGVCMKTYNGNVVALQSGYTWSTQPDSLEVYRVSGYFQEEPWTATAD
jgi:hypothetical protein